MSTSTLQPPSTTVFTVPSPKSFADVVGTSRSTSISLKSPSSHKGEPALFFSEEDIVALSSPFKYALIGKFSHGRPPLTEIKSVFEAIGLKATYSLGLLDPRHVLIRFAHEDDYHRVWLREIWYLQKIPMRVFKWSPDFRANEESSIALVWVNMPHLPVHFFAKQSLFSIAGLIGLPLKMDAATASLTRPSVARICVEMNLLQKFPNRVWIGTGSGGFWQPLEYEHAPKYCLQCLKQGHDQVECKFAEKKANVVQDPIGGIVNGVSKTGTENVEGRKGIHQVYRPVQKIVEGIQMENVLVEDLQRKQVMKEGKQHVDLGENTEVKMPSVLKI